MMKLRPLRLLCVLVFAVFCVPARLPARTRTHTAKTKQSVPPHHRALEPRRQERHVRRTAAAVPPARHRGKAAKLVAVSRTRIPRRSLAIEPERAVFHRQAASIAAAHSVLATSPWLETMVVHPPELTDENDVDLVPPSIPMPVVSVVRKTTDRPQLPSVEDAAVKPVILPSLYDKSGHLVVPPAMRGSHEILLHQNEMADRDGLARVQDDSDMDWMRRRGMLVSLPVSSALRVDERLPGNRRYSRPWTAQFLVDLARAHYAQFHTPIQVNSAVRTVQFQQRLLRTNGNAAPAGGETASPHLTGQAVDLAKRGSSLSEIAWMRGYLLPLVQDGKIDVEEEFQQACFHISVYKGYLPTLPVPRNIAVTHRDSPAALAIALQ